MGDGTRLAIGGADRRVTILNVATAAVEKSFPAQADPVFDLLPLSDGRIFTIYFDADGKGPYHFGFWNLGDGAFTPFAAPEATGGAAVGGKLWLAASKGRDLTLTEQ